MNAFQTAWKHLRRTPYQTLAAVAVMTLNLFVASVFVTTAFSLEQILRFFETRPQVTAYFKPETANSQVESLKEKLLSTESVNSVKYVSKEEALSIYRGWFKDDPLLLEMVSANMLPASLEVSADRLSSLPEIAQKLKEEEFVDEVAFQEDVVSRLSFWTKAIRQTGLVFIGFTSIISFLVILIITGMKIASRKEEIEILRLIGASGWYIRKPFLIEGIFYGVFGAIVAWLSTYILILYLTPSLVGFLEGIPLLVLPTTSPLPTIFMLSTLAGLFLGGMLIGVLGSFLSVKRYLRNLK